MNKKEANERVARLKKQIADYTNVAPFVGISKKDQERTINLLLDDLSRELNKLKEE